MSRAGPRGVPTDAVTANRWRSWPEVAATGVLAAVLSWQYSGLLALLDPSHTIFPEAGIAESADITHFSAVGEAVLRGDLAAGYAESSVQAGPLQLVLDALVVRGFAGSPEAWSVARFAIMWVFLLVAVLLCRPRNSERGPRLAAVAFVAVLTAMQQPVAFYGWGHWWHLPVMLLMALAAGCAASHRPLAAGLALGLAVWLEPFAALGIAVFVLSPGVWAAVKSTATAAIVGGAAYLPFVLTGSFAMGDRTWPVSGGTWASLLRVDSATFSVSWPLRLAQSVLVVVLAGLIVWRLRDRLPLPALALVAAVCVVLARIATEAFWWPYYWLVPLVFLGAAALRLAWLRRPEAIPLGLGAWLGAFVAPLSGPLAAVLALVLVALCPLPAWAALWARLAGAGRRPTAS
ncbi:MAG: hypothetical protein IPO93_06065 [Actinobacteria bacterium]|nr:hypothetical protein [Actinomycetota bacterium]